MDSRGAVDLATNLARTQDRVILRAQAEALGVTPGQWRWMVSNEWKRLLDGVAFVPDSEPLWSRSPDARAWGHAAVLRTGGEGVLCLGSSLRIAGVEGTPPGDPEHVLTHGRRHQPAGVRLHFERVPRSFGVRVGRLTLTDIRYSVFQALREWDRETAVSVLDSARLRGLLPASDVESLRVSPLPAERRAWIDLSDPKAESPLETRTRLMLGDAGLRGFESQVWLVVPGLGRVRVDFRRGRVVLEADGRSAHDGPTPAWRDRRRTEALEAAGFVVVRVTWADAVYRPAETVERILRAMGLAALGVG